MLTILIPLLIAVVGVLIYALASNPKLVRIGEILFFCGTLVVTALLGGQHLTL